MGREKDRKLRRRKQRKKKLRKLKIKLAEAKNDTQRKMIIEKIRRVSVANKYIPEF